MDKQEFIGNYLNKKLKNHNLPYGLQYLNLVAETEEKAEKAWKQKLKVKRQKNESK